MADIKATTELLDKVVNEFAAQLDDYMQTMNSQMSSINSAVNVLAEGWQGSDYDAFKENMDERMGIIRAEMDKCKKLKEWLEVKATEYRKLLNILNRAGKR